jgi:hypothetical protein
MFLKLVGVNFVYGFAEKLQFRGVGYIFWGCFGAGFVFACCFGVFLVLGVAGFDVELFGFLLFFELFVLCVVCFVNVEVVVYSSEFKVYVCFGFSFWVCVELRFGDL